MSKGLSFLHKISAWFWRIYECDHGTNQCIDIGDEDIGFYWYCFRCEKKI